MVFKPIRDLLGLRRLYAVGAKICSYEYRFAEYEYDEIRRYAQTSVQCVLGVAWSMKSNTDPAKFPSGSCPFTTLPK